MSAEGKLKFIKRKGSIPTVKLELKKKDDGRIARKLGRQKRK